MNKAAIKNIAFILLLVIAVFSLARYVSELKLRFSLQNSLLQAQGEVAQLSQEKQNLLQELRKEKGIKEQLAQENRALKSYLKAAKNRISRFFRENEQSKSGKRRSPALNKEGNRGYLLKDGKPTMKTRIEVIPVP